MFTKEKIDDLKNYVLEQYFPCYEFPESQFD